jgi:hypothetical protein
MGCQAAAAAFGSEEAGTGGGTGGAGCFGAFNGPVPEEAVVEDGGTGDVRTAG